MGFHRLVLFGLVASVVLAQLTFATKPVHASTAFIGRSGTDLIDPSSDPFSDQRYVFTGMNIYNANSNGACWYQFSDADLANAMNGLVPLGGASSSIRNRVVRAWFFQQLATVNGVRDWTAFDRTISAARNNGFRVIPTLIDQWGDCGSLTQGFGYKSESWYTTSYTQPDPVGTVSYRDWAGEIASRYADDPTILAWELVNEPEVKPYKDGPCSPNAEATLKAFATDVSNIIKAADPNHLISIGTGGGGQCGAQGAEYQDLHAIPNVDLCSYHDYSPNSVMPGDAFNGLAVRIKQCTAIDKPVFIGESGIKPADVGGTLDARAAAFQLKFHAQLDAGVSGELLWAWNKDGSTINNFDVGPGDPVLRVLDQVSTAFYNALDFAVSHDGKRVAVFANDAPRIQIYLGLYVANPDGSDPVAVTSCCPYSPDFSSDDRQIVFSETDSLGFPTIDVVPATGGDIRQVSGSTYAERYPRWSPDGTSILVVAAPDPNTPPHQIREINLNTLADTLVVDVSPNVLLRGAVYGAGGSTVVFVATDPTNQCQIYSVSRGGGPVSTLTHFTAQQGCVSIDSSLAPQNPGQILFPMGQVIETMSADGSNLTPTMYSKDGYVEARWTARGEIAYILGGRPILRAPVAPLPPVTNPVAAAGDATASVSWSPPALDGGSAISSYTVTASPGGATAAVPGSSTTAMVSGLTNSTAYTFTVRANNAPGSSAPSLSSNPVTPQAGSVMPATVQQALSGGGSATTDPGSGPTASLPVTSAVTLPVDSGPATVSITQSSVSEPAPAGFSLVGEQVQISAPPQTPDKPLTLTFALDSSATMGATATTLQIYRTENGGTPTAVADCAGSTGTASPDPCVASRAALAGGDIRITVLTSNASVWNLALPTPPTVTVVTPAAGGTYKLKQIVNASYSCTDTRYGIASCTGTVPNGTAINTGSIGTMTFTVTGRNNAGTAATVVRTYAVIFDFSGFFSPLANPPTLNGAKAGTDVTETFSLGGKQGTAIVASGYPKVQAISCTTLAPTGSSATLSYSLHYGSAAFPTRYYLEWTSQKAWANTCRAVTIRFIDGTDHVAYFKFTK